MKKITEDMLEAFLGDASNYQSRENLRYECEQDQEVRQNVIDYWEMLSGGDNNAQSSWPM